MSAQQARGKRWLKLALPLALLVLAGWVFFNRQMLNDQLVLASYEPPARIAALAEDADLSQKGTQRFYVTQPQLHGKKSFGDVCGGVGDEQSNVLGCFTGQRIYIYDVPGEQLQNVEEVTAAHEMLHAAYMRLDGAERERVNQLIQRQLDKNVAPHVQELIGVYERLEPGQLLNEMHSILATEQRKLIPELEQYFDQYFDDRMTVVSLAAEYRDVFDSLQREQQALVAELNSLANRIDRLTNQLNEQIAEYNAAVQEFNQEARSGQMTAEEYDRRKAELDARRGEINQAIAFNNNLRDEYKQKRERYEALAVQFTELQTKIDSTPPEI